MDVDELDPFLQEMVSDLILSLAEARLRQSEGARPRRDAFPFTRKIASQLAPKMFNRAIQRSAEGPDSGRSTKRWSAPVRDQLGE